MHEPSAAGGWSEIFGQPLGRGRHHESGLADARTTSAGRDKAWDRLLNDIARTLGIVTPGAMTALHETRFAAALRDRGKTTLLLDELDFIARERDPRAFAYPSGFFAKSGLKQYLLTRNEGGYRLSPTLDIQLENGAPD